MIKYPISSMFYPLFMCFLVPLFRRAPQAGGNQPGGRAQNSEIGPSPSPSTSVHRLMDSKSAIPSLCVFQASYLNLHVVRLLGHANCPPPWHTFARFYTQKEQCKKLPFFERVFSRPMKLGVQNTLSTLLLHDD